MAWKHRTVRQEIAVVGLIKDHSQREVGAITGLSQWTVQDILRKYHVPATRARSGSSASFRYAYDYAKWYAILRYLYVDRRLPIAEVAERVNLDPNTVSRRLRQLAIPTRTAAESNRGTTRRPYNWKVLRPCAGCAGRVRKEGEDYCAACRKRTARA